MIYTAEQKKRIENILAAFRDYIDGSKEVDVVYSKKAGYVWIPIGEIAKSMVHEIIEEPGVLLLRLFSEIYLDVSRECIRDDEVRSELNSEEIAELQRRIESYINSMTDSRDYCQAYMEQYIRKLREGKKKV